ncbi:MULTISPECIES: VPLPA-CTERM sorting domain-containing protein [unclassified Methylophaga]|jgi:hypothetical protein|uniref:PEP-CTERM sorting domain-containing protein n=1 Tax=Pseudidiomarina aestuarii TaxID=624146 RepID=A0A2T4CZF1_9GAMM|nr:MULTISPECIES: VPLPA-CTERM sorting domain-containing protein [unclassified Methylophaga]MAL50818.1 hypothetical protein [Methylophaga sp.]MBP24742.1 hypothetical protein [Methylophaga sp.]PTB86919.1 hypothetical protein C9940_00420 [Pseudidiomarina aestuarii]|tara:strand:- start:8241 stop:8795 length:555 start_codon:yes stop_codon:yes gene_type:complete
MNTYIKSLVIAGMATLSFAVNAATLSLTNPVNYLTPAGPPGHEGTISTVVNITDYMPGASSGYLIEDALPNAVDASQLQTALNAAGAGFIVTDFTKIEPPPVGNIFDSSSLGIAFQGFLMKYSNFTMVGLFNSPITQLSYTTHTGQDVSHIAYFNTSAVPLPAALWLLAPTLIGFLGLRRRFAS